ncbi:unnamed protein product [Urochloa humidicola]
MAVVLVILLLATFLPPTAHAASSPAAFSFFLACGAESIIPFPGDNPARNFNPDGQYLASSRNTEALTNPNSNSAASVLYAAARASTSAFSYNLPIPSSDAQQAAASFLVLRLHFFPFAASQSSVSISSSRFAVSVRDGAYTVLPSFTPPSSGVVKEFFIPAASGDFRVTFTPDPGSAAFVNAVELFPAPAELLWNSSYTTVGAAANVDAWQQQALETVYRLNVGGPTVTKENDPLWRTWLLDDPFLFGPEGISMVNTTRSPIVYADYTRAVAPDAVYRSQRATNASAGKEFLQPALFNLTWTFPAEARSNYLVRLHFCDYEQVSNVVGVGIMFNVFIGPDIGTADLMPTKMMETQANTAFYLDYAATAPVTGNLTVSIGKSVKSSADEGGFLNGLEIMRLRAASSTGSSRASKRRTVLIATLSAVLGASVLACAALCLVILLRRRRRHVARPAPEAEKDGSTLPWSPYTQDNSSGWPMEPSSRSGGEGTTTGAMHRVGTQQLHIPLEELRAATDGFHDRNLIGVGGFGNVYRGVLRDGTRVAVKRATRKSKQGLPEFQTEIVVLSRIRHRHLVSLIGYCNEQAEMILVYEYMDKGTLRSHLYGSDGDAPPLSWKQRLEICIGAARGLHYLHTGYSENIIHRDVKSTNILLGDGYIAKVADFGLSRIGPSFGETHVSTAVKGSFGYLDPEYFKTQQLTDKSDVYSFGVVLFEVLCARPVIDQALDRDQINLTEWAAASQRRGQLDRIADPRIAGQVNENSLRKFAETAERCLADYGQDRPSMGDVLWNLEYCLQLQETHVRRDAFEDSGAVGAQFPEDVVVPRWVPSSTSFLTTGDPDDTAVSITDVNAANSKVFSQLSGGEGR